MTEQDNRVENLDNPLCSTVTYNKVKADAPVCKKRRVDEPKEINVKNNAEFKSFLKESCKCLSEYKYFLAKLNLNVPEVVRQNSLGFISSDFRNKSSVSLKGMAEEESDDEENVDTWRIV